MLKKLGLLLFSIIFISFIAFFSLKAFEKYFTYHPKLIKRAYFVVDHYQDYAGAEAKNNQLPKIAPKKSINEPLSKIENNEEPQINFSEKVKSFFQVLKPKTENRKIDQVASSQESSQGQGIEATSSTAVQSEIILTDHEPRLIQGDLPKYPRKAELLGIESDLKLRLHVNQEGKVVNFEFLSGNSNYGFREEIEKAVKNWQFEPLIIGNKPAAFQIIKEFSFKK